MHLPGGEVVLVPALDLINHQEGAGKYRGEVSWEYNRLLDNHEMLARLGFPLDDVWPGGEEVAARLFSQVADTAPSWDEVGQPPADAEEGAGAGVAADRAATAARFRAVQRRTARAPCHTAAVARS
eukprot:gene26635-20611_t